MGYTAITFSGDDERIREQWLNARKQGIGGSDASAILGLNDYATPYTVWLEKTGRTESADLSDNEKVYWGNVLEDVIAQEFAKRHPEYVVKEPGAMFASMEYPFMLASVDRLLYSVDGDEVIQYIEAEPSAVLEIKTCGERRRADWDDGVPPYYLAQVMHYMAVTGLDTAYVAVLIGGQEYREYEIKRDESDIAYLVEQEGKFWEMVENDTMPPFTGSSIDNEALMNQFPASDGSMVEALDDDVPIMELQQLKDQIKDLEKDKKRLESDIRAAIGDAKGIITPRYKCTWVRTESSRFDGKRFAEDHPELHEEYSYTAPRDMGLRISKAK